MCEVVADYNDQCGECPVWDESTVSLYWTDGLSNRFYLYDSRSGKSRVVNNRLEIKGFRLNASGGFVVTNSVGIWLWNEGQQATLVADQVDGEPCRMNDCVADVHGRLLGGSVFYDPGDNYPLGKLICVETNGRIKIIDEGFHLSNGLGFSPNNELLYVTDSMARRIYVYNYDPDSGEAHDRRALVQVPSDEGIPDGLAVDSEGFLWSAQWYGSCVVRYDPDGAVERKIVIPAKQTSCVAFGGQDLGDLYITSAGLSQPTPAMPTGYDHVSGNFGGALYRMRADVKGLIQARARISLATRIGTQISGDSDVSA